jgi:heterotetrameric sarcosine oxidase gamma subunit
MEAHISHASDLRKLDVRGRIPCDPPAKQWQLAPTHALITSTQPIPHVPSSAVTDVSSVYSAILLAGESSRDVLHKLTTLNVSESAMPVGAARQTRLAHVNAIILREPDAFLILNTRDVFVHVWESLMHAGAKPK